MAYMQKYPTSAKVPDLFASVADLAIDPVVPDPINTVVLDPGHPGSGEGDFNWPPPSAATRGFAALKRA